MAMIVGGLAQSTRGGSLSARQKKEKKEQENITSAGANLHYRSTAFCFEGVFMDTALQMALQMGQAGFEFLDYTPEMGQQKVTDGFLGTRRDTHNTQQATSVSQHYDIRRREGPQGKNDGVADYPTLFGRLRRADFGPGAKAVLVPPPGQRTRATGPVLSTLCCTLHYRGG